MASALSELLRKRGLRGAGAAAALLIGCRHFEAMPLLPDQSATALEARSLDEPGLRAFLEQQQGRALPDWPLPRWDLEALTLAALYHHPGLEVARAGWGVARAGIVTAGARPNPTLAIVPEYTSNAASAVSPWIAAASFDWPIETAGKRGHRIARAEQLAASARLGLVASAWRVRAVLRASLVDLVAARARTSQLEGELGLAEEIAGLLEQRLRAGAIRAPELVPARLALLGTRAELVQARREELHARARVAEALGLPASALEGVELELGFPLAQDGADGLASAEVRGLTLRSRADLLAALAEYEAGQAALQLEIARQFPDLHIGPGYQFDQGDSKWAIGLSIELPVLNRNQGPIAEAEARRAELAARFIELQAGILGEIDRALAVRSAAREELAAADELVAAQRARLASTQAALAAGAGDRLELRAAGVELARGERARLEAQLHLQRALGDLEAAVQQPIASLPALAIESKPGPALAGDRP